MGVPPPVAHRDEVDIYQISSTYYYAVNILGKMRSSITGVGQNIAQFEQGYFLMHICQHKHC